MANENGSKKRAAIIAAINAYLEQEAEAQKPAPSPPRPSSTLWSIAGREEIMWMRMLYQRRIVSR